jgi:hypothetical protein
MVATGKTLRFLMPTILETALTLQALVTNTWAMISVPLTSLWDLLQESSVGTDSLTIVHIERIALAMAY